MTSEELVRRAKKEYGPAISLDRYLPPNWRRVLARVSFVVAFLSGISILFVQLMRVSQSIAFIPQEVWVYANKMFLYTDTLYGIFFIAVSFRLGVFLMEAFRRSYYFRGFDEVHTSGDARSVSMPYEVAEIVLTRPLGLKHTIFARSKIGFSILSRAGLPVKEISKLYKEGGKPSVPPLSLETPVTLSSYADTIFDSDERFRNTLRKNGITREIFTGTAVWIENANRISAEKERWWSKSALESVSPVGEQFAYGETNAIEKYGYSIEKDSVFRMTAHSQRWNDEEVKNVEAILARGREANVLLVGEEGASAVEIIAALAHKIKRGQALPELLHNRIFLLDGASLVSAAQNKQIFEKELLKVLSQATHAGNVILVIKHFPALLTGADSLNSNVVDLLTPLLASPSLHIVGITDTDRFHSDIEKSGLLQRFFDVVYIEEASEVAVVQALERSVPYLEDKHDVFITYPALVSVAEGAERYITGGVMPDKALDLLSELVSFARSKSETRITVNTVQEFLKGKTGIPLGAVDAEEKEKLENLEEQLHKSIIGQDAAVTALSGALRRARAGVNDPDRPIGSFLFLGPTGVGKTETAETLAEIFFGDRDAMLRLDMSEYNGADALERLIGDYGQGKPGVFTSLLREKPYCLILLDEFEKADKEVLDLFLQIIDEGQFSDMRGKKINAKNTIIIATSNAGSSLIWQWFQDGIAVATKKDQLIDAIIKDGTYRPELINRFDGVIVFHPLSQEHILAISRLSLSKLSERMRDKGIEFVVTDGLVEAVAKGGYDPEFGARPMKRFIQERVEQVVADKILSGDIKAGAKLELDAKDVL